MARKSNGAQLSGEYLSLAVAAHLAGTQLLPQMYAGKHVAEMLNIVALALARTAPIYLPDAHSGEPRQLAPHELEGATVRSGAAQLVLQDGRALAGASLRRVELRQAIAMLKARGLRQFAPQLAAAIDQAKAPRVAEAPAPPRPAPEALRARLEEVEALLAPPLLGTQVERAKAAAIWIARNAPQGRVANLAMQLMSALQDRHDAADEMPGGHRMALARLRAALDELVSEAKAA